MSHTGSVRVLWAEPNPPFEMFRLLELPVLTGGGKGAAGTGVGFWLEVRGGGGMLEGIKWEEETGIWTCGGAGSRAGRTVVGPAWTLAWMRFSISSMSDWEEAWRRTVSLWRAFDIFPRENARPFAPQGIWLGTRDKCYWVDLAPAGFYISR